MTILFEYIVSVQRELYLAFSDRIDAFSASGDWSILLVYVPMGVLLGAVHATTPGHSKAVLATYIAGSGASLPSALMTSVTLSFTHIVTSVAIVVLSLPLIRFGFGADAGRAPDLERVSGILLAGIALWMLWRAARCPREHAGQGHMAFGAIAGLVPCPLTLFVMTLALARGVPEAGIAFAITMMIGVGIILSVVAATSFVFRGRLLAVFATRPLLLDRAIRVIQGLCAAFLLALAVAVALP